MLTNPNSPSYLAAITALTDASVAAASASLRDAIAAAEVAYANACGTSADYTRTPFKEALAATTSKYVDLKCQRACETAGI